MNMGVLGVTFTKLSVERAPQVNAQLQVNSNVDIKGMEKKDVGIIDKTKQTIQFSFEYITKFEPKAGKIIIHGHLSYLDAKEKIEVMAKEWKKTKKLPEEIVVSVMNSILTKSSEVAVILTREVNLPPPVQFPKVKEK
jgi:hypothetical protein